MTVSFKSDFFQQYDRSKDKQPFRTSCLDDSEASAPEEEQIESNDAFDRPPDDDSPATVVVQAASATSSVPSASASASTIAASRPLTAAQIRMDRLRRRIQNKAARSGDLAADAPDT